MGRHRTVRPFAQGAGIRPQGESHGFINGPVGQSPSESSLRPSKNHSTGGASSGFAGRVGARNPSETRRSRADRNQVRIWAVGIAATPNSGAKVGESSTLEMDGSE